MPVVFIESIPTMMDGRAKIAVSSCSWWSYAVEIIPVSAADAENNVSA